MSNGASPSKWSLVPLLAAAGFISGNGSLVFIWTLGIHPAVFVFFASLTLGLVLASVLWHRGILHSWQAAASFVATTAAVHVLGALAPHRTVHLLGRELALPLLGAPDVPALPGYFLIALTMYTAVLLILVHGTSRLWAPVIGLGVAALSAVVFASLPAPEHWWAIFWNPTPLFAMWGTVLGCFLGAAVALSNARVSPQPKPYAAFYALVVHAAAFCVFTGVMGAIEMKRLPELEARRKVERAARMASAPSRDNLPTVTRQPFERVLVMEPIGPCHPSEPTRSGEMIGREDRVDHLYVPPPAQVPYEVVYWCGGQSREEVLRDGALVTVSATEYPTATWAAYELTNGRRPGALTPVTRFGQSVYLDGHALKWSSGNKLLFITGVTDYPALTVDLVKAYLTKYPSSS
jgi:hypothetical protein